MFRSIRSMGLGRQAYGRRYTRYLTFLITPSRISRQVQGSKFHDRSGHEHFLFFVSQYWPRPPSETQFYLTQPRHLIIIKCKRARIVHLRSIVCTPPPSSRANGIMNKLAG